MAPEDTRRAREIFTRKVVGNTEVTDEVVVVVDAEGSHIPVEISSVPLRRGEHVVGVFGQVSDVLEEPHAHPALHLTPRQAEVLRLLERGRSTAPIAEELGLSRSNIDGGLSLLELAQAMVELGAESAINLDGGGSTTLVHRGHLLNRPTRPRTSRRPSLVGS